MCLSVFSISSAASNREKTRLVEGAATHQRIRSCAHLDDFPSSNRPRAYAAAGGVLVAAPVADGAEPLLAHGTRIRPLRPGK